MRIDEKTKDEKLQHDIHRAALKIDKFEYLTGGEILHPHRRSRIHLYINCENIGKTSKNYWGVRKTNEEKPYRSREKNN